MAPDRPDGLNRGYYVRPTVFGGVTPDMTIAREEIFGPVLSVIPYTDEEQAIAIANDTAYGLAAYVQSADIDHARRGWPPGLRAGSVYLNGMPNVGHLRALRRLQAVRQWPRMG